MKKNIVIECENVRGGPVEGRRIKLETHISRRPLHGNTKGDV